MDPAPIRRWNPGFIALRWRHLFWGLPLLGLLAGLVVHFLPMIRATATGVVQLRPALPSTAGLPVFGPSDVAPIIRSDDLILQAVLAVDLPQRWRMASEDCVTKLRDAIRVECIRGTALVEITVNGGNRKESELIWNALVTALEEHLKVLCNLRDQATLAPLETAVNLQKAEVETKRNALIKAFQPQDLLFRPNSPAPITSEEIANLRAEFENAQKLLELLQIKHLSEKMQCKLRESPMIIHQAPGTPAPVTPWDTLRPIVLHSTIGVGAGMFLAVILAYLLELLFPRKAPTL